MSINIGLDQEIRNQIAQFLGLILADTYTLYVKTQNFHWNVVDSRFYALHKFLEEQYEALANGIDDLAERIRMLGERSPGTLKQFIEMTSLKESSGDISADEMLKNLLHDHETLIRQLRERIEQSNSLLDQGTGDLLINRIRFHEKSAWMLRSHFKKSS